MTQSQIIDFDNLIDLFYKLGLLEYIEFIGSWATFLYKTHFNDSNYIPLLRTRDIDILYPNIRRPSKSIDIKSALKDIGFDMSVDRNSGVTRFYKDGDFELEFLVQEKGAGNALSYLISPLDIQAEGLRNMDILIKNTMFIVWNGKSVLVPLPAASILHKLVINAERKPEWKQQKDIESAEYLFNYIKNIPAESNQLQTLFSTLTVKQQNKILISSSKFTNPEAFISFVTTPDT